MADSSKKSSKVPLLPTTTASPAPSPPQQAPSIRCEQVCGGLGGAALVLVIFVPLFLCIEYVARESAKEAEYTVAIAAVAGLDPAAVLAGWALDPAFNLTVRVEVPSYAGEECVGHGTVAAVSYLRAALAEGPAPEFCVGAGEARVEASVMAWRDGARLPRFARESLARELPRGEAVFDVTLTTPAPRSGQEKMVACRARVGEGGAAPPLCKVSMFEATSPVPEQGVHASPAGHGAREVFANRSPGDV